MLIQETKKQILDRTCLSSFWGSHNRNWIAIASIGTAGRLLIAWKCYIFDLEVEYGTFSFSVKLKEKQDGNRWWIICIYGPSSNTAKSDFWTELNDKLALVHQR